MQQSGKKKIGIMGGTFDPIHVGHLILAESAYEQFHLNQVLVMPSGNPPHKINRAGRADTAQRVKMVQLAIKDNPHLVLSMEEVGDEHFTYTHETLERLRGIHPDYEFYFILGSDSLYSFDTWKEPERICRSCIIVAAIRNNLGLKELDSRIAYLKEHYRAEIVKLNTPNIDISSQTIRTWIENKRTIKYYVPDDVVRFIADNKLYKSSNV